MEKYERMVNPAVNAIPNINDGVCEGEYRHPTQEEIITFNNKENAIRKDIIDQRLNEINKKDLQYLEDKAQEWGKTLIDRELLGKLKDFDYWKEWKHRREEE